MTTRHLLIEHLNKLVRKIIVRSESFVNYHIFLRRYTARI